jgi:DNA polymerase III epsilon subunit-like protein
MILFYDLETTGLPKPGDDPLRQPGIVQIGAALVDPDVWEFDNDGIEDEFNMLVNPELLPDRFEPGAVKVNGISWNDAQAHPSFFTVGEEFAKFCIGAHIRSGYNIIDFDDKILMWQLRRYGMEFNYPWAPTVVDVAKLAKASGRYIGKKGPKFPKLVELYADVTGSKLEGAHDAMHDIRATVRVARILFAQGFRVR